MLPITWTPLREEALRLAEELQDAACLRPHGFGPRWKRLGDDCQRRRLGDQMYLIGNLDRPESRDLWRRWGEEREIIRDGGGLDWEACGDDPQALLGALSEVNAELASLIETT